MELRLHLPYITSENAHDLLIHNKTLNLGLKRFCYLMHWREKAIFLYLSPHLRVIDEEALLLWKSSWILS